MNAKHAQRDIHKRASYTHTYVHINSIKPLGYGQWTGYIVLCYLTLCPSVLVLMFLCL